MVLKNISDEIDDEYDFDASPVRQPTTEPPAISSVRRASNSIAQQMVQQALASQLAGLSHGAAVEPAVRSLLNQSQPALIIVSIPDARDRVLIQSNARRLDGVDWRATLYHEWRVKNT